MSGRHPSFCHRVGVGRGWHTRSVGLGSPCWLFAAINEVSRTFLTDPAGQAGLGLRSPEGAQASWPVVRCTEQLCEGRLPLSPQIDLQKMPLGKLSKRQIQAAYSILSEVQQVGGAELRLKGGGGEVVRWHAPTREDLEVSLIP